MEIGEKSKVGLSPDSHNAWEPAQDAGFHIPPATAAAGTMKVNTAEPLESRGCSDSCTEPLKDQSTQVRRPVDISRGIHLHTSSNCPLRSVDKARRFSSRSRSNHFEPTTWGIVRPS